MTIMVMSKCNNVKMCNNDNEMTMVVMKVIIYGMRIVIMCDGNINQWIIIMSIMSKCIMWK